MTHRFGWAALVVVGMAGVPSLADEVKPADLPKARLEAAQDTFKGIQDRAKIDPNFHAAGEMLYLWSRRWMDAEQSLATDKAGRITALRGHLERMRKLEELTAENRKQGMVAAYEVSQARYYRVEAQIRLDEAKGK
jgi:hypothetical protein